MRSSPLLVGQAVPPASKWQAKRPAPRGSALIAVLWLVAALSVIAFSVAGTVRSEVQRTSTAIDGEKAYFLATGAVERALLYMGWRFYTTPDGSPLYWDGISPALRFEFPTGRAVVELIPETSKMNVNYAAPEELYQLLMALGAGPVRSRDIALGIVDWRTPEVGGADAADQLSLPIAPTFRPRHASFEEIEELLMVRGMTPELFYGTYERNPDGRLVPRHGLRDCLSVYGSTAQFDVNTVDPAVMAAIGIPADSIASIVQMRRLRPFRSAEELNAVGAGLPVFNRLGVGIGGSQVYTIRATAQARLASGAFSDARRSVAAVVRMLDRSKFDQPYHVLRWYDNVWVE
jgi:general secretion pathway protein K